MGWIDLLQGYVMMGEEHRFLIHSELSYPRPEFIDYDWHRNRAYGAATWEQKSNYYSPIELEEKKVIAMFNSRIEQLISQVRSEYTVECDDQFVLTIYYQILEFFNGGSRRQWKMKREILRILPISQVVSNAR